jgi:GH24 family phage-related lysozyme (muramidase)
VAKPKWDVNSYRIGHGSSTITQADGTIIKLSRDKSKKGNYKIDKATAGRDLKRRIKDEFAKKVKKQITPAIYDSLPSGTIAALISVAYNYGHLYKSVVTAVKTKNIEKIAKAVESLSSNKGRRAREAKLIRESVNQKEEVIIADPTLPRNFAKVPLGDDIYRSSQPTKGQFKYILENKDFNINTVMRLNGETARGLSREEEKEYVESLGKKYIYIDAHDPGGAIPGKGYINSIKKAKKPLEEGHILVHCTGGMDRTGYQIGKFLQDEGYGSKEDIWEYTIPFNNWISHICKPPKLKSGGKNYGYIRYMEAFYPLKEWCEEDVRRADCESCKKYGYSKK